jgi:hypothetical protein
MQPSEAPTVRLAVMVTVLLSTFAHGLSAAPGIELFTRRTAVLDPSAPEHKGARPAQLSPPPPT